MSAPGVYTSLAELTALQALAHGGLTRGQPPSSVLAGRRASRLRGRGLAFEELRDYRHGDDVRRIDWRVTARTGRVHLRLFAEEREQPVMLIVDQRLSMFFGTHTQMKSVTAAELAALMAWQILGAGDRVGALIFDDDTHTEIEPHRSRTTVLRILKQLTHYNQQLSLTRTPLPPTAPGQLDAMLTGALRRVRSNWLVVVISDFHGISADTRSLVHAIGRHNDVVAAMIHDPAALNFPHAGQRILGDGHRQAEFNLSAEKTRATLLGMKTQRDDFLARLRRELDIPCLAIDTCGHVYRQLANALGSHPSAR
jgi:uncharacterized protein (DUF58 family)